MSFDWSLLISAPACCDFIRGGLASLLWVCILVLGIRRFKELYLKRVIIDSRQPLTWDGLT